MPYTRRAVSDFGIVTGSFTRNTAAKSTAPESISYSVTSSRVGAGDDEQVVFAAVQRGVVGYEQVALKHPLDHRVATLPDEQLAALVHCGADIVVVHRHLGQRREHIQLRHRAGGGLDAAKLRRKVAQQLLKEFALQHQQPLAGAQDLVFQVFQILGDVALGIGQRLLAHKVRGHLIGEGFADLDVIAEHPVEAHLQGADAGLLLKLCLHLGQKALAAVDDVPQFVHLRREAFPDDAAVLEGGGGVLVDGGHDAVVDVGEGVDLHRQRLQLGAVKALGQLPQTGQLGAGGGQGVHLFGGGAAVDRAGHQPLHIEHMAQRLDDLGPLHALSVQPRPTHLADDKAASSVTRTSSIDKLLSI